MADPKKELERVIEENGGKLIRSQNHRVYRFPSGMLFTIAKTPTCPFAFANALVDLKNMLNLNPPDRGKPGERRERKVKQRPKARPFEVSETVVMKPTWRGQLAEVRKMIQR